MKTFTRCPHCQTVNSVRFGLLGKPMTCETCHRIFISAELPLEERAVAERALEKKIPFKAESDTYRVENVDLAMVRVPPGMFVMGSDDGFMNERPVHHVTLTQPFYIATCLVTQSQYQQIMEDSPSYFEGDTHPVETISWDQAMEFCRRLTERETVAKRLPEGAFFRLPTEAEWEYACGQQGPIPVPLTDVAWFQANSDGRTHPVKTKTPNPLGLYDMLGNVGEWCLDDYGVYAGDTSKDPISTTSSGRKVRRGGSWASAAARCGRAGRVGVSPSCRCALIGFRVVLSQGGTCPYNRDFLVV
ncbi:MAG: SUMF1/EgtB/PvdO family nonheme iron enzyme [Lentisphaeria bacterium]|nr:SUMF1/EgtB/PvdO family nonheme iron enzyme [Lentisphaeria bacterium]